MVCEKGPFLGHNLGEGLRSKEQYPPHQLVSPVPKVQAVVIEADGSSVYGSHICVTQQRPTSCPTPRQEALHSGAFKKVASLQMRLLLLI